MAIRAVLFDIGGTLLFIDPHCLSVAARGRMSVAECAAAELAARPVVANYFRPRAGEGTTPSTEAHDSFRRLMKGIYALGGLNGAEADEAVERLDRMNKHLSVWRHPNPEASASLADLAARGLRLAILSNSDGRAEELLVATGLRDWFEFVVDSSREKVEKPNPEIFRRALARFDLPGSEVAYVGDLPPVDLPGCEANGIHGIIYDPGNYFAGEDFSRVSDLRKISRIVSP